MLILLFACFATPTPPAAETPAPPEAVEPLAPPVPQDEPAPPSLEEPSVQAAPPIAPAPAVDLTLPPRPRGLRAEYTMKGACPFECCRYSDLWRPTTDLVLHSAMDGKIIGTIPANTPITGLTGTVKVKPGAARITSAYVLEAADDTRITTEVGRMVYLLDEIGEGDSNVWYEGKIYQGDTMFGIEDCKQNPSECWAVLLTKPSQRWWAKVKTPSGQVGWIDMDKSEMIEGVDAC